MILEPVKEITLHIKDSKFGFFMELIKSLDFVKVDEKDLGDSRESVLQNLKNGLDEVKQFNKGTLKTTPAKAFLDEL